MNNLKRHLAYFIARTWTITKWLVKKTLEKTKSFRMFMWKKVMKRISSRSENEPIPKGYTSRRNWKRLILIILIPIIAIGMVIGAYVLYNQTTIPEESLNSYFEWTLKILGGLVAVVVAILLISLMWWAKIHMPKKVLRIVVYTTMTVTSIAIVVLKWDFFGEKIKAFKPTLPEWNIAENVPQIVLVVLALSLFGLAFRVGKFRLVACLAVGLIALHSVTFLYFPNFWEEWSKHWELFWALNVGLLAIIFLSLLESRLPGAKWLAFLLFLIVGGGSLYHFSKTPVGEKYLKPATETDTKSVYWEKGMGTTFPGKASESYSLGIRNLRIDGNVLSYDIWSMKGRGNIGWAKLTKLPATLDPETSRFYGNFNRTDTGISGEIWLEPVERGRSFHGKVSWRLVDGTMVQYPTELHKR